MFDQEWRIELYILAQEEEIVLVRLSDKLKTSWLTKVQQTSNYQGFNG